MPELARLKACVRGAVQGVGFRPFVYRLATELGLWGWVNNSTQGVFLEVEGPRPDLETFIRKLEHDKPPRSFIQSLEFSWLDPAGYTQFDIRASDPGGAKTALVLPDLATCPDCLREIFDPSNRRYAYPFTNCTNCGPRFTIIESLPYDRPNTTMRRFTMCPQCQAEYANPLDRRFHAQPNACPVCGPHLELWNSQGHLLASRQEALQKTTEALRTGQIVAVKGLGGFHLMVRAGDDAAVRRLRELKRREEKPFALMCPALESVEALCHVDEFERRLLRSPEAPIVLLSRRCPGGVAESVAPANPNLGIMLPYTPLHHLLLHLVGEPVVATSGNRSDEPICTDEREALNHLAGMADLFLVHNRPIVRHADDSIVRIILGREMMMRRARGYAPLPITLRDPLPSCLSVGAHLKNCVALAVGPHVFISQHIGDLETEEAFSAFERVINDFERLYETKPARIAADLHPDYLSTKFASETGLPVTGVQHHYAHALSCMAENELDPPVLGVSWDGTGYGPDGSVWGGEFLLIDREGYRRFAHWRQFRLPGGDKAVKEPRRVALGLLFELYGAAVFDRDDLAPLRAFSASERKQLKTMLERGINSPLTSSAGRLFDAVASLAGLRQIVRHEGQAAMELEFAAERSEEKGFYPVRLTPSAQAGAPLVVDSQGIVDNLISDIKSHLDTPQIAARFHNSLVEAIILVARQAGLPRIMLSGGCFQNRRLMISAVERLREAGFRPYWHQRVPPNDGGIALGQMIAAAREKT